MKRIGFYVALLIVVCATLALAAISDPWFVQGTTQYTVLGGTPTTTPVPAGQIPGQPTGANYFLTQPNPTANNVTTNISQALGYLPTGTKLTISAYGYATSQYDNDPTCGGYGVQGSIGLGYVVHGQTNLNILVTSQQSQVGPLSVNTTISSPANYDVVLQSNMQELQNSYAYYDPKTGQTICKFSATPLVGNGLLTDIAVTIVYPGGGYQGVFR